MTEVLVSEIILPMTRINQATRALQAVGRRSSGVFEKRIEKIEKTTTTMMLEMNKKYLLHYFDRPFLYQVDGTLKF